MAEALPDDRRCVGDNRDGSRCQRRARNGADTCSAHGEDGRRCTGHISGISHPEFAGERCRRMARLGQDVCDKHGGNSPQAKLAAARRLLEAELMTFAEVMVGAPVDNPLTELAGLAGRARAWMEILQARVEKLLEVSEGSDSEDGGGKNQGIRYQAGAGEQVRAEIQLYERAMDRLGKFLADFGRLGIDARLAAISEKQADTVIGAIEAALNAAGVRDQTQRSAAKTAAARHLRSVA